jgi:2-dehydro-3-deoxyphosphogluconate aldolase/(4S)-4-hydroxy-2-oxoglutarate aldolase
VAGKVTRDNAAVPPRKSLEGSPALRNAPIIVVIRAPSTERLLPAVTALVEGGIRSIELTLTTPGVLAAIPVIRASVGSEVQLGAGTVTSAAAAQKAIAAGSDYLVTPTLELDVVAEAITNDVPVVVGGLTPSELFAGWRAGASAVKVFPASVVGASYVNHLRGPFPDIQVVPSGGVDEDTGVEWLRAGAVAISVGGPLLRDIFVDGDTASLRARTEKLVSRVRAVMAQRSGT